MDRDTILKGMKAMKAKAKAARKEGKRAASVMFRSASKRLKRKLRGLKAATAPKGEGAAPS